MRKITTAAVAAVLLVPAPARADETVVGFNDGERGFISVTLTPDAGERAPVDMFAVTANCHYWMSGSSDDDSMSVVVYGEAATGPRMMRTETMPAVPVGTLATCVLRSEAGALLSSSSRSVLGPVATVVDVVELDVQALAVCVSAHALFSNGRFIPLDERCEPAAAIVG